MRRVWIILVILGLFACKKKQDKTELNETIYVRNQGADMPVYMRGNIASNAVMLLLHGGPGGNALEYRPGKWTEELEKHVAVAYWDQRGQGMSHGHYKKADATVGQLANDLEALVKVVKAKYGNGISVFIYAHSWGGTLATEFMLTGNNQQTVKGWIQSNGSPDIPQLNRHAVVMYRNVAQEQIALGNHVSDWESVLSWANGLDTNKLTIEDGGEINKRGHEVENWLRADKVLLSPEEGGNRTALLTGPTNPITSSITGKWTSAYLFNEIETYSRTSELNKVTLPTLFLWGKYDFVVPPAVGTDMYGQISAQHKKLVVFDRSGHSPMSSEWRPYVKEIVAFIATHK